MMIRRGLVFGLTLAALTLAGCATPNGDGSWDLGQDAPRYQPPTVAALIAYPTLASGTLSASMALMAA